MSRNQRASELPSWLWFFLALPLGLVVVLLWQRRRLAALIQDPPEVLRKPVQMFQRVRYSEPDSIPIDTRLPVEEASETAFTETHAKINLVDEIEVESAAESETESAPDSLEIIEGIGSKIAGLLNKQGIRTFRALANTPIERLDQILVEANLRRISDPGTWPEQARLAAAADWDGLEQLKSTLKGGRRTTQE